VREQISQTGEVVVARKISAQDLAIHWSSDAEQILRQIRVGNAFTFFDGKRFKIHEATQSSVSLPIGTIAVRDGNVLVGSQKGSVQLTTVQPEGKPRVLAKDWARGARLSDTSVFSDR
jgi:methionyl-tRNA formyltransferase